jgi:hypothetical protein
MWANQPDVWAVIRHPEPHKSAFWQALLVCGHFADVVTDVEWRPEDGPTYPTPKRLEEMRAEAADLDRWHKRLLAADWPRPAPFRECYMCSVVRKLVAYEPVDWVAPRPKPIKLSKPRRIPQVSRAASSSRRTVVGEDWALVALVGGA